MAQLTIGMYPKKGTLQPGSDADFIIWRNEETRKPITIRKAELLHDASDYTPYEGIEVGDWPKLVYLRGKLAYNGETNTIVVKEGEGEFIKRGLSTLP